MNLKSQIIRERYKINEEIARGGMGVVYLAKDLLTNNEVALKISSWANEAQTREAFETEAKLLARLDHAGVPKVRDYFLLENNFQALVMDYVEGDTLSEIFSSGDYRAGQFMHPSVVIDWTAQILDILIYLHGFSPPVIHRDIKPNNLKLQPGGTIVLLDFGLAKGSEMSVVGGGSCYSSLEQLNLVSTDPRSDIYALGATVYHLLTNGVPLNAMTRFQAICGNGFNLSDKSLQNDPQKAVSEINPQISAEISDVVMKALAVFPENRFQTAAEMKEALESARSRLTNLSMSFNNGRSNAKAAVSERNRSKTLLDVNEEKLGVWTSKTADLAERSDPAKATSLVSTGKEADRTHLSFQTNKSKTDTAENLTNDDFTTFEISRPHDSKPVKKASKKILSAALGISAIAVLLVAGIAALIFFQSKNRETVKNEPSPVLLSSEAADQPLEISTYLVGDGEKETKLNAEHLFADGEEFRFGVKSSSDGFLYVISRNNEEKAQLAYPKPNQINNSIEKNSESAFPPDDGKFGFDKDSPSEMWAYFVVVGSRESDLAKRIRAVLGNNQEKNLSTPDVEKLFKDLDQIAKDSAKNRVDKTDLKEKADVLITKLQKK